MVLISESLTFYAKIGIPVTLASSFKNGLSTRWVLIIYPILARTRVASNKRVWSGASKNTAD